VNFHLVAVCSASLRGSLRHSASVRRLDLVSSKSIAEGRRGFAEGRRGFAEGRRGFAEGRKAKSGGVALVRLWQVNGYVALPTFPTAGFWGVGRYQGLLILEPGALVEEEAEVVGFQAEAVKVDKGCIHLAHLLRNDPLDH